MIDRPPAASPAWAYFLDFDGTLVEIAATPDAVRVTADLKQCLLALHDATGGALAVVSGRSIATIDALMAPARLPVAGLHGAEQRLQPDGAAERVVEERPLTPEAATALDKLAGAHPGVVIEHKGLSTAIHFRRNPEAERDCLAAAGAIVAGDPEHWRLLRGKMVIEIKPTQVHKGDVVRRWMEQSPFAGRLPVFVGDDVTDEDGFHACRALGGLAVRVGAPPEGLETAATHGLTDPDGVLKWLLGATGRRRASVGAAS